MLFLQHALVIREVQPWLWRAVAFRQFFFNLLNSSEAKLTDFMNTGFGLRRTVSTLFSRSTLGFQCVNTPAARISGARFVLSNREIVLGIRRGPLHFFI